ncbi:MAG: hypothetical protein AAF399_26290, partial [Bacteroidota bacterium]
MNHWPFQFTFRENKPIHDWSGEDSIWGEVSFPNDHLKHAIKKWFTTEDAEASQESELTVVILFIDNEALRNPILDQLAFQDKEEFQFSPIICVGTEAIFQQRKETEESEYQTYLYGEKVEKRDTDTDRYDGWIQTLRDRHRFWDSNIWHRYISLVQLESSKQEEDKPETNREKFYPGNAFKTEFMSVIEEIKSYHNKGLYFSVVGHEFVDYQRRKLAQCYYEVSFEGHSEEVSPYYWHSETERKRQAEKLRKKIADFQWEAVLADDFAVKSLRIDKEYKANWEAIIPSKLTLIRNLLNQGTEELLILHPPISPQQQEEGGENQCGTTDAEDFSRYPVQTTTTYLKNHPHIDLILSDHYHGRESDPSEKYGYQLMQRIKSDQNLNPHLGKYWVFPVSAFDEAFRSSLRVHGISQHSNFLQIDDGADPVNTPELFRYRMYSFLENYVENIGLGLKEFFQTTESVLEEILTKSSQENSTQESALRKVLKYYYPSIVRLNL